MAEINETQRANSIKAALHIAEYSSADSQSKINAICQALHPDDIKAIETGIVTTLKQLLPKA